MTPLQAKQVLSEANIAVGFGGPLREAIQTAIKFIEENCFEWVKIEGPETLPEQWTDVLLCFTIGNKSENYRYSIAHTYASVGLLKWRIKDFPEAEYCVPVAWRVLPKPIKY